MRVLAIDASLRNTGVAIIDAANGKARALYFGVIHNPNTLRSSSCLVAIRDRLAELIHAHEPDCCALEAVIYVQSYKTAIILGAARGAAILAAAERGLPVFEYAPTAKMINVIKRAFASPQIDQVLNGRDKIFVGQDPLRRVNIDTELLINFIATDPAKIIFLGIEKESLE